MPKFAANLTFLFTELAFLDRFKAARDVGFRAVEFMFPYDYEKEELVKRLQSFPVRVYRSDRVRQLDRLRIQTVKRHPLKP